MRYGKIFVGRMTRPRGIAVPLQKLNKIGRQTSPQTRLWYSSATLAYRPRHMRKTILYTLLAMMPAGLQAGDFIEVMTANVSEARNGCSYTASVDIPVAGDGTVIHAAKLWICDAIDIDVPTDIDDADFAALLRKGATEYLSDDEGTSRNVEITWAYEDPTCVTFTMHTTDRDSVDWVTDDVASFSKADGHRITPDEIFSCDERQIKRLMWSARKGIGMEVSSADDLYVGNAGYIDGWVLVIGPAQQSSGTAYRLRYEQMEKYLRIGNEGYYAGEK